MSRCEWKGWSVVDQTLTTHTTVLIVVLSTLPCPLEVVWAGGEWELSREWQRITPSTLYTAQGDGGPAAVT